MDRFRSKKQKIQKGAASSDEDQDFISDLPEEVKGKILSSLSTREAVQTCILSTKWRYTWASIPELSIRDSDFISPNAIGRITRSRITRSRFIKFVDVLLLLHNGPIFKFKLETVNNYRDGFDRWILHLSRRNELCEFSLRLDAIYMYYLPTSFFSCHGLSILSLHDCGIKLPRGFAGFQLMRVLELRGCLINGDDLEKFVSSCPLLDELTLGKVRARVHNSCLSLKICAPKLKKLIIHGRFASVVLKTPCLVKACIDLEAVPAGINGRRANLVEALGALPEVEVLGLHQQFFAYLAAGSLPDHLPSTLNKLKMLALDVNLAAPEEASLTRLLLQNAPYLQELYLTNSTRDWGSSCARLWEIGPGGFFMSLHVVELYEFSLSGSELAFFKFILGSAPLLEQITLIREKDTDAKEKEVVVEILMQMPRLSSNVQITFE